MLRIAHVMAVMLYVDCETRIMFCYSEMNRYSCWMFIWRLNNFNKFDNVDILPTSYI